MNQWIAIGNLTRDPETKPTPGGKTVAKFGIAVNGAQYTDKNGEKQRDTTFVDCECWEKTADFVSKYFKKGDPILVTGEIRMSSWDQDGVKRSKLFCKVTNVEFLPINSPKVEGDTKPAKTAPKKRAPALPPEEADLSAEESLDDITSDEIPF